MNRHSSHLSSQCALAISSFIVTMNLGMNLDRSNSLHGSGASQAFNIVSIDNNLGNVRMQWPGENAASLLKRGSKNCNSDRSTSRLFVVENYLTNNEW
jgi:hypothetical protein